MRRPTTGGAMGWRAVQLAGVQLIFFVRLLVLARLLDPEAFGLVAIALVALSVIMRLSDLGMIPALVQRADATPEQYDVAWTVGLTRAFLVGLVMLAAAPILAPVFGEPRASTLIQVFALRPIIEAFASIGVARLTRELRFREVALIQAPGAVADTITAIALAPLIGVWALVAGSLAGAITTTTLSYRFAPHRPRLNFRFHAAAPLIRYGRWVLLTGIVALAGTSTSQLLISREIGAVALGLYFLAARLAFLPADAMSSVVGAVAFPLYVQHGSDTRRSASTFNALLGGQLMILLPTYALMIALAPGIADVLGARWAGTAPVVQILSVACITGIYGESLTHLLMGRGRSDRVLNLEIVQSGVLLLALYPLISRFGVPGAALAWLAGNVASQVAGIHYGRQTAPGIGSGLLRPISVALVAALASASVALAVRWLIDGFIGFVAALAAGLVTVALAVWGLDQRHDLRLSELLPWSPAWAAGSASAPRQMRETIVAADALRAPGRETSARDAMKEGIV